MHKVVCLDGHVKPPKLDFEHEFVLYEGTSLDQIVERVQDATILICAAAKIPRKAIENAPKLQLIACMGTGSDQVDKDAARECGINVCNVPAQNTESVTEHSFALYYAVKKHIVPLHNFTATGEEWQKSRVVVKQFERAPRTNGEETLVVIGYGALGKSVEKMAKALGMKVLIAERKCADPVREGRIAFQEALKAGTTFILTAPLDTSTRDMIGVTELQAMDSSAIIINVGRGGVINETALAQALKDRKIAGAGTDVFEHEPATRDNCPLLDPAVPNLVFTPHIAWFSSKTIKGTLATIKATVEAFVAGHPQNVVVAGKGVA